MGDDVIFHIDNLTQLVLMDEVGIFLSIDLCDFEMWMNDVKLGIDRHESKRFNLLKLFKATTGPLPNTYIGMPTDESNIQAMKLNSIDLTILDIMK